MRIVRRLADLPHLEGRLGFVPTMGALHEGHLSLIRASTLECEQTAVSLFVNPLQFGPQEDLGRYPRSEARDIELAQEAGADLMFIPEAAELLSHGATTVHVAGVSELYEGQRRPGHFDGVATIVAKLFNLVKPQLAYFGLKDRQQCAVIRQMTQDLNFPLALKFMPTVREKDGLALSSRNAYLSAKERDIAPEIYRQLRDSRESLIVDGVIDTVKIANIMQQGSSNLQQRGFEVDYFDLVDETCFQPTPRLDGNSVLIVAAQLGRTRLIDNLSIYAI